MIAVEGDEYNEIFNECLRKGVPITILAQEKYEKYEEYCRVIPQKDSPISRCNATYCSGQPNNTSSTNLNDERTNGHQEPQPQSHDSGASSSQTASGSSSGEMTVISIDYATIHQEVRPRGNSGCAASPPQSGYFSDLGNDGAVSPPLSAVFSNLGSGDMDIEHEE